MESKIGVYICSGCDIDQALDVDELVKVAGKECKAPVSKTHPFLCSEEGVQLMKEDQKNEGVNRFMIAACSQRYHEATFDMGDDSLVVRAPIREYVAWTQKTKDENGEFDEDTQLAGEEYIQMYYAKIKKHGIPEAFEQDTSKNLLVIGGGVSGMTAAMEAANAGYSVNLVEKEDHLGGFCLDEYKLIPAQAPFRDPQMNSVSEAVSAVASNNLITVHASSFVVSISGQPGEFQVKLNTDGGFKEFKSGAIIMATGSHPYDAEKLTELGIKYENVISSAEFEQMAKSGKIQRKDGKPALNIGFIQCAGSRTPEHLPYCSGTCCMDSLKQAAYIREQNPDAKAHIIYRDIRTPGLYEDFYRTRQDDPGVFLTQGDVVGVNETENKNIAIDVDNTLFGEPVTMEMDLVVLAVGQVPSTMKGESALNLQYHQGPDLPELKYGYPDSHFICFPYETRRTGIYAVGSVRQPMDINDAKLDATGAALKAIQAMELTDQGKTVHPRVGDLTFPEFALSRCTSCKRCTEECPFGVLEVDDKGMPLPNPARCRSCGICMGSCPVQIISFKDSSPNIFKEMMTSYEMPDEFDEKPRVLIFVCENDALPVFDMAALERLKINTNVRIMPMRCLGGTNLIYVTDALSFGYDGIMFMGCAFGDDYQCHFVNGSELANMRLSKVQETIGRLNLEPERVRQYAISMNDYEKLPKIIDDFVEELEDFGPNPFKGM
ncbi:MAG TPA: heterodisulfide reductase subunit A [Deltaproteobacteria bacterium]|nr:heterodisulfide reductase subunit A [Deltaproteobacteria bacterium]